jgi:putative FmdB family regulatory protein
MPTYEYRCDKCGEHHEVVQSFRDEPLTVCPACGGPLRKVFGAIGVVFKGSGFYKNDSRTSGKAADKGTGKDSESGKDSKDTQQKVSAESTSGSSDSSSSKAESTKAPGSAGSDSSSPAKPAAAAS